MVCLLIGGLIVQGARDRSAATSGETAITLVNPGSADRREKDPFALYFTGHWCDDWRKVSLDMQLRNSMWDSTLPHSVPPGWGKIKLIDLKGMTPAEKFLVRAFAGLINRRVATWYIVDQDEFWLGRGKAPWNDGIMGQPFTGYFAPDGQGRIPQQIGGPGGYPGLQKQGNDNTEFLGRLKRFCNQLDPAGENPSMFKGFVVYDPALLDLNAKPRQPRAVLNAVRTICAVENALPVTPELHRALRGVAWEDNGYDDLMAGAPVILDTTQQQEWMIAQHLGDEEAAARHVYTWLYNNYWDKCCQKALAFIPPAGPNGQDHDLTDYIVEFGLFTFYIDGSSNLDERQMELYLAQTPANIPVLGTLTERVGAEGAEDRVRLIRLLSRFGKYFVGADGARCLSLHSGEYPLQKQPLRQKPASAGAFDQSKTYVAFCLTTGNSVGALVGLRPHHWDQASRGRVPVGWALPVLAADACPNIVKFYYQTASENDGFLADVSGLGQLEFGNFGAVAANRAEVLGQFLQLTDAYLQFLDLPIIWTDRMNNDLLKTVTAGLPHANAMFYGLTSHKGRFENDRMAYSVGQKPFVFTYLGTSNSRQTLANLAQELANTQARFVLVGVDETEFGPEEDVVGLIAQAAESLGGQFEVVRPDVFVTTYRQAVAAKAISPGPPELAPRWAESDQPLELPRLAKAGLTIDGQLADWKASSAKTLQLTSQGDISFGASERQNAADLSATVQVAYDDRFLYVAAQVRDDTVFVDDLARDRGDSVEVLLDTREGPFRDSRPTEGFYRLHLVPAAGLVPKAEVLLRYPTFDTGLVNWNKNGIQHRIASRRTADGYCLEAAIPLLNFPYLQWKPGARLSFGVAVNDLDEGADVETRMQWGGGNAAENALELVPTRLL